METSISWSADGGKAVGADGVGWLADRIDMYGEYDVWQVDDALWGLRGVEALRGVGQVFLLVGESGGLAGRGKCNRYFLDM